MLCCASLYHRGFRVRYSYIWYGNLQVNAVQLRTEIAIGGRRPGMCAPDSGCMLHWIMVLSKLDFKLMQAKETKIAKIKLHRKKVLARCTQTTRSLSSPLLTAFCCAQYCSYACVSRNRIHRVSWWRIQCCSSRCPFFLTPWTLFAMGGK